jgi:hypothetical protein
MIERIEFASLTDCARVADRAPKDGASYSTDAAHSDESWTMGVTRPKAIVLARHGWPDGAAQAKRLLADLELPPIQETHSVTQYDVTGSYVDIGEYVQGTPECMVAFQEDKRAVRFLHIVVSGYYAAIQDSEEVMRRGVAIVAVIDALESRGIRCSVELLTRFHPTFEVSVRLKETTDPLNLDVLAFAVAHPAMFRRVLFGVADAQPDETRNRLGFRTGCGYGQVIPLEQSEGVLLFQSMRRSERWDLASAKQRVQAAVEEYSERRSV